MKYLVVILCLLLFACTMGGCVFLAIEKPDVPNGLYWGLGIGGILLLVFAGNVLGFKNFPDKDDIGD